MLFLLLFKTELSVIAMIGIILLIGIVKKNAIMMIDFALVAEREHGKTPEEAIFEACLLRFRPIMMTTMAALLGGLPLALGHGVGAELRRPLGITIVGGLIVSQCLTLFTTPGRLPLRRPPPRPRRKSSRPHPHAPPRRTTPRRRRLTANLFTCRCHCPFSRRHPEQREGSPHSRHCP